MEDLALRASEFQAAVAAWHENGNDSSRLNAVHPFNNLEVWQQEIILDLVTVSGHMRRDTFLRVMEYAHDTAASGWIAALQQHGLVVPHPEEFPSAPLIANPSLTRWARSILQDPHSRHYGSRLWVEGGSDSRIVGAQEVSMKNTVCASLKLDVPSPFADVLACFLAADTAGQSVQP
jgi:hypothetical protein